MLPRPLIEMIDDYSFRVCSGIEHRAAVGFHEEATRRGCLRSLKIDGLNLSSPNFISREGNEHSVRMYVVSRIIAVSNDSRTGS